MLLPLSVLSLIVSVWFVSFLIPPPLPAFPALSLQENSLMHGAVR